MLVVLEVLLPIAVRMLVKEDYPHVLHSPQLREIGCKQNQICEEKPYHVLLMLCIRLDGAEPSYLFDKVSVRDKQLYMGAELLL